MSGSDPRTERENWAKAGALDKFKLVLIALILALGIRTFLIEPFKIPSGSMIPTLLVGDYILVTKLAYGVRLPFSRHRLIPIGEPRRGDVIVFRYPDDPGQDFVKRVIGLPGDTVRIRDGRLELNGDLLDRIPEGRFSYTDYVQHGEISYRRFLERNPDGIEYTIIHDIGSDPSAGRGPWDVPAGKYFVMGDNRDHSRDSRVWRNPFVAADQIEGRAVMVHWSWMVVRGVERERGFTAGLLHTLYRVVTFQIDEMRWGRIGRAIDGVAD